MATIGDPAPDFSLIDQHGDTVALADLRGHRTLVFFYPKANTPGCTTQACGLRDIAGAIGDVTILGISPDTPKKQHNWDTKHYELGTAYGHIALEVPDAAAACAQIKARGGKVVREAGPMKHGTTIIAFVEDPDGYKVELIQR